LKTDLYNKKIVFFDRCSLSQMHYAEISRRNTRSRMARDSKHVTLKDSRR